MMHGHYPSLSDPNKQNFFLPTHHSRKLRHLRGKVLKVHKLTAIESIYESEQVDQLNFNVAEKKITKDELRYEEAYRGRDIDPFSSVSGTVSFNLFLPPLARSDTQQGLLCEGVWWDVPKGAKDKRHIDQEIQIPSEQLLKAPPIPYAKTLVDSCLNSDIPTALSKQHSRQSILQEPLKTKFKVQYLGSETSAYLLPKQERTGKVTQFKFEAIPQDEGKVVSNLSKFSILPPINRLDQIQGAPHDDTKNEEETFEHEHEEFFSDDIIHEGKTNEKSNWPCNLPDNNILLTHQSPAIGYHDQTESYNINTDFESEQEKERLRSDVAKGACQTTVMKRKHSGYHRSINRLRKNLHNIENIRLLDNWIEILESTEIVSVPPVHVSDFFGHQTMGKSSTSLFKNYKPVLKGPAATPSSIDIMNFFDKPRSAMQRFDQFRSLNRQACLMKMLQCSRKIISKKCEEEMFAAHNIQPGEDDDGTLAPLLAIHGLSHLVKKPTVQQDTKYVLHKAPKRLMINPDLIGSLSDKRRKHHDELDHGHVNDQKNKMSQKIILDSESIIVPSTYVATSSLSIDQNLADKEFIHQSSTDGQESEKEMAEDTLIENVKKVTPLFDNASTSVSEKRDPKKNAGRSMIQMALPDDIHANPTQQLLRGSMRLQLERKEPFSSQEHSRKTTRHGGILDMQLDNSPAIDETIPEKRPRLSKHEVLPPIPQKQGDAVHGTLESKTLLPNYGKLDHFSDQEMVHSKQHSLDQSIDVVDEKLPFQKTAGTTSEHKKERKKTKHESKQDTKSYNIISDLPIGQSQLLHEATKGERTPRIEVLSDDSKPSKKVGKFVYSTTKKEKRPTIKGYSTCLIEGGSVTYHHTLVPPLSGTAQGVDEATGKFSFLRRKNQKHLKMKGKDKSVKKINPLLKYGIPAGKLPTAMLLMTAADLPPDRQLHYLSKEKLDAIKLALKDQYPDIPEEAWDDPEVLVSLLPTLINSGCIDIATLLEFSDEVITAALDKCDIDALLSRPDVMNDPCLYKRIMAEKMAREAGLTGAAKEKLREFIDKNMEIFMDPDGKGFVPVIPPAVAKLMEMVQAGKGEGRLNEAEIMEALSKLENECGKGVSNSEKMVYDHKLKKMVRLDSATIACNPEHGIDLSAKRRKRQKKQLQAMKRRLRELEEAEIIIERREGETSAEFRKREKKEKKEIMRKRRLEARRKEEEAIVIERREGETSAEFRKREKKERREIMKRRRREARYEEEEEIVIQRREGETSAEFRKREKRERKQIMRKRRLEEKIEELKEMVLERREGETSAEFRRREKKLKKKLRRLKEELEEEEYDEEMRSRWERKKQRRADRKMRRDRGEVVSSTSEDDSSLERWERRRKRRDRRRRGSDYDDSEDDSERAERRERRRIRREKQKDRRRRREAGEIVSSTTSYDSSSYYDSTDSDSFFDSSFDSSSYFDSSSFSDSSYFSDSDASSATRYRRRKKREKQRRARKREKARRKRREAGIDESDSDYYDNSSDYYSSSFDSLDGLTKQERRQRRKERRERRRREREEDKLLSPESRKRRRKERREERKEERRQRRREKKGYDSREQSTRAMMKEIGQVMEVVKYVRDAAGNMVATTLKGTRSAIRKLIQENQYYDDPKGEIFTIWDEDSIPEIEPFVDSPGYYNEDGEYIEYTPEERRKRREEHMAAVLEREMLIAARQKKLEKLQEQAMEQAKAGRKEKKNDEAISRKKRIHDAAMKKFKKQEERRREKEFYENAVVEDYYDIFNVWRDMDYLYIASYMGQKYAAELKKAEIAKEEEERAFYHKNVVLLQAQRNELLRRLRHTKQEFFLRAEVELSEIAELLYISRAFVFSYFDNVFGPR